ncbi:MAG: Ig-like domain-containing protein [Zavarzinella sp.]
MARQLLVLGWLGMCLTLAHGAEAPGLKLVNNQLVLPNCKTAPDKVCVISGTDEEIAARPALAGTWVAKGNDLWFQPKYPLVAGVSYRVFMSDKKIIDVTVPKLVQEAPQLVGVYPSGDRLPENLLRIYLRFSQPMARGGVYQHFSLIREDGTEVDQPFLQLDEELWNEDQTRLTLLIDPGRIKQGVKPREDQGPALSQGKKFTLKIRKAITNANGKPLQEDFVKKFSVVEPFEFSPDPTQWKIVEPTAANSAVGLVFERTMDYALLQRKIEVLDDQGKAIVGKISLSKNETVWNFTPTGGWEAGKTYQVRVDRTLEDVCGNTINKPFEVDAIKPDPKLVKPDYSEFFFTISAK